MSSHWQIEVASALTRVIAVAFRCRELDEMLEKQAESRERVLAAVMDGNPDRKAKTLEIPGRKRCARRSPKHINTSGAVGTIVQNQILIIDSVA